MLSEKVHSTILTVMVLLFDNHFTLLKFISTNIHFISLELFLEYNRVSKKTILQNLEPVN